MLRSILVVAAHPDDEVLGCGGTIAKLSQEGAVIHVAFLADGVRSRSVGLRAEDQELIDRQKAANNACAILGVNSVSFGDFPDNQMDSVPLLVIVKVIEGLIEKYQPDTIFTHHIGDANVDHRRLHEAVMVAARPQSNNPVSTILTFEIPSSTEWGFYGASQVFSPNWYIDISAVIDIKFKALLEYKKELREWPHPRSLQGIRHLMHWRGGTVGVDAAEAFILQRRIR